MPGDHQSFLSKGLISIYLFQMSLLPLPFILESFHSSIRFICQVFLLHSSVPSPSILPRRPVFGYYGQTFQCSIIPYFEKGRLCLFSWQISCLLAFISEGFGFHILSKVSSTIPALLIHSKPVRQNYSTIFSLLSEVNDLFIIISCKLFPLPFKILSHILYGGDLSTSLQMLFYHHSSLFLPSLIFLHVIEITFYFEKMAKQLKEGGLVYYALFYPHSFLSEVIPVHIFFRSLFYHPSWLYHTFLVRRMLPDHHSFLCEGDHASLLQSMEQ